MFKALGVLVVLSTVYAASTGAVHAKSGPGGRVSSRDESLEYFWIMIAIHAGLSIALLSSF